MADDDNDSGYLKINHQPEPVPLPPPQSGSDAEPRSVNTPYQPPVEPQLAPAPRPDQTYPQLENPQVHIFEDTPMSQEPSSSANVSSPYFQSDGIPQPEYPETSQGPSLLAKIGVVCGVVIVLVVAAFAVKVLVLGNKDYATYKITNSGSSYIFTYFKGASSITNNGIHELASTNTNGKNTTIVAAYPISPSGTCSSGLNSFVPRFTVSIGGKKYPVCSDANHQIVVVNFTVAGAMNQMTVFSNNGSAKLDFNAMKKIISSVSVRQTT